jgi:CheY-like chemotaxis protein
LAHKTGAVLIVEDEMLIRLNLTETLEDAGLSAIGAKDADHALDILEHRSDVTLMFTDINMPGSMDGLALAKLVKAIWPPIVVMMTSSKMPDWALCHLPEGVRFFSKPYDTAMLLQAIQAGC